MIEGIVGVYDRKFLGYSPGMLAALQSHLGNTLERGRNCESNDV
jgi:hypothetical protein